MSVEARARPDVVLAEISERGLSLTVAGGDLRLQGPRENIDPGLVEKIRACKPELLAVLGPAHEPRPDGATELTALARAYLLARGDGTGGVASHVHHEIEGSWDIERLETALNRVVARHDSLRTRFGGLEAGEPWQVSEPSATSRIVRHDLTGLSSEEQSSRRTDLRDRLARRVLALDHAPLLAVDVLVLGPGEMVLHVGHDGLVVDGISMFLIFRDWHSAYIDGEPAGSAGPSLAEYVENRRTAADRAPAERSRRYWADRIDSLPGCPQLPLAATAASERAPFVPRAVHLAPPSWSALREAAAANGVTASAVLLAAWAEVLVTWGAGTEFSLVATVATRPPFHPGMATAIGQFSDTVIVDVAADRRRPFPTRARDTAERLRAAVDHRHLSGTEVLRQLARRDPSRARMPYTFNSAIDHGIDGVDGSALELFGTEVFTVSRTPQVWLNVFAMERHGGLVVQVDAVDERFPAGMLDDVVAAYQTLLTRLVDADGWSGGPSDLRPNGQRERRARANDTSAPVAPERIHDEILRHAERAPSAPAVVTSGATMDYGELLARAEAAAGWLRDHGVGRDELVGLVMARGPETVVGVLAVHLAGAAYLPVDAGQPAARRSGLLADGVVRRVLTNASDACAPEGLPDADTAVLVLDAAGPVPPAPAGGAVRAPGEPDDLAYVLYTSGTTGAPKGVMISHRSVVNVVDDCNRRFGVGAGDRFFCVSAFTFDLSVYDIAGGLRAGAALVLPDHDRAADPRHWLELCADAGVTVWNSVPAIIAALAEEARATDTVRADGGPATSSLRLVLASGDRVPAGLPATVSRVAPRARFVALGGPTETTIWNVSHPVGPADNGRDAIPLGVPNANNRAYVIDADGFDTPDWVEGEICAAGTGLARGYRGAPERTEEKFLDDPVRGERLYRTGDLGYWRPSGEIAITGRLDHQIKVNGYRIEAGEIEVRLTAVDGVNAAAAAREPGPRGDRLVAHVVARADVEDAVLRAELRRELPEYMVPAAFVRHEALPLTGNGKVDRSALGSSISGAGDADTEGDADRDPSSPSEEAVAEIWRELLKLDRVGAGRTLPELGVDSLTAARILSAVRRRFGVTIALERIVEVDTVALMARRVDDLLAGTGPSDGDAR